MGNQVINYPTVGTSALKPSADPIAHASAVIVSFPGCREPRHSTGSVSSRTILYPTYTGKAASCSTEASHASGTYKSTIKNSALYQTLRYGTFSGKDFAQASTTQVTICTLLFGLATIAAAFVTI